MESKSHALAAGIFVLVVAAMLIGLAVWLLRDTTSTVAYEMVSDTAVTGLQPQAAVQFKGVAVGKVATIGFDPEDRSKVLVRIEVSPDAPITRFTYATLTFQGVTGLSFVQLDDPGGSNQPPVPGPHGGVPRIPLRGSTLGQLTDRASDLLSKVETATDNINQMLGSTNQAALTDALKQIGGAAKALNQLATDTDKTIRVQFGPGRADVPALMRQATGTLKSLEGASTKASATLDEINAAAIDLRHGVGTLTGKDGTIDRLSDSITTVNTVTLPRIQGMTEDASHAFRRFDRVLDAIDQNPQSLLYGEGAVAPGPGEPGFTAPPARVTPPSR